MAAKLSYKEKLREKGHLKSKLKQQQQQQTSIANPDTAVNYRIVFCYIKTINLYTLFLNQLTFC